MEKHKIASISLSVPDRAISSKFLTHRVSKKCTFGNFQKIFPSPKMAAILPKTAKHKIASISLTVRDRAISSKFSTHRVSKEFLPKTAKHKIASISLTVRDRAISSKFSTHRVYKECSLANFQKNFPFPKMAAILNFRIFAKNGKTQNCFYLLNRAR